MLELGGFVELPALGGCPLRGGLAYYLTVPRPPSHEKAVRIIFWKRQLGAQRKKIQEINDVQWLRRLDNGTRA